MYAVCLCVYCVRPVTSGAQGVKGPPKLFSPPWKNVLDVV